MTEKTVIPPIPPTWPRAIEILAFPAVQLLDVAGPLQVFAAANALTSGGGFAVPYARNVVAAEALVVCSAGLGLVTDLWPVADAALDTLFVPGGQGVDAAASDPISLNWVRRRGRDARRVASVCTGAFVLVSWGIAA